MAAGYATVAGGNVNSARGSYSFIGGGLGDTTTYAASYSTVFGRVVKCDAPYQALFFNSAYPGALAINRDANSGNCSNKIKNCSRG